MNKVVYLLCGTQGSGKTTFAKTIGGLIFEIDDYNGLYDEAGKMNISLLPDAHKWCKNNFEEAASRSEPCLIHTIINYDSQNTKHYIDVADRYGYLLLVVKPQYGRLFYPNPLRTKEEQILHFIETEETTKFIPVSFIGTRHGSI